jgi:hypothetical protein
MLKKMVILILMLGLCGISIDVFASPFLVSDKQCKYIAEVAENCTASYEWSLDGGTTWVPIDSQNIGENDIRVRHDLASMPDGLNSVQIRGVNIWGESISVPFEFTKAAPEALTGIRIIP